MPILANPMPISGQSVTSYVINHRTSPLCGMVPSLLGGRNPCHHAIPAQYRPILCQAWANPLQIQCKYGMVPSPFGGTKPSHPVATQCKLNANPWPLLGTIQNQSDPFFCQFKPIQCQSGANLMSFQGQLLGPISILQFL